MPLCGCTRANIPVMEMRKFTKVKINKLLDRYKLKKSKNHATDGIKINLDIFLSDICTGNL